MPNLKRLILTPNAEYETFDRENINNAKNYKINTFNCANLTDFTITAPYRNSYNDCEILGEKEIEKVKRVVVGKENKNIIPENIVIATGTISTATGEFISYDSGSTTISTIDYIKTTPNTVHTISGAWATIHYYDADKNYISNASATGSFTTPSFCEYIRYKIDTIDHPSWKNFKIIAPVDIIETVTTILVLPEKAYPEKRPNQVFIANELDLSNTQIENVKLLCTTDVNSLKLSKFTKDFVIDSAYDLDEYYLLDGDYDNIHTELKQCYQSHFTDNVLLDEEVPNIIPSASDGSLIFAIHTADTEQIQDKVWDFSGTEMENIQIFGANNNIVQDENGNITMPNRIDEYDIIINNRSYRREVIRYTTSKLGIFPTINPEFSYTYELKYLEDNKYQYSIIADSLDNMPTFITFENELNLLSVEHAKTDSMNTFYRMFYNCKNLTSVATEDWNTSNITSMAGLFTGCAKLTSLNLSSWDTSNVITMNAMFSSCNNLSELQIDKDNWNTSNVRDMGYMFYNCAKLKYVDLSLFDTRSNENLSYTFSLSGFTQSVYEGVKDWDVRKVRNMEGMCRNNDEKITSLEPFRNWKTDSLNLTMLCWQGCQFTSIEPLKNWNWTNVHALVYYLHYCTKLSDMTGIGQWNIKSIGSMSEMLINIAAEEIDLSGWASAATNLTTLYSAMSSCSKLKTVNLSGWKPKNPVNLYRLFFYTTKLERFILDNASISVSSLEDTFYGCNYLTSEGFDPTKLTTANCTRMNRTFLGCHAITSMDLSSWDLGKCTTVSEMFGACRELTSVKFNQGANSITNAELMFRDCPKLTYLEPPMLDKVTTATFDLSSCPLDVDSAVRVMNNLGTSTSSQVLKFSATTLASLSEEQIAIATNKGWTVE
jgi:surface protein